MGNRGAREADIDLHHFGTLAATRIGDGATDLGAADGRIGISEGGIGEAVAEGIHRGSSLTADVSSGSLAIIHIGVAPVVDVILQHAVGTELRVAG